MPPPHLIRTLCLTLLLAGPVTAAEKQATEAQIRRLKQEIVQVQRNLDEQQGAARKLSRSLQQSEQSIGALSKQIRQLDAQLAKLNGHADGLEAKRDRLKVELETRRRVIEVQLRQQYKLGRQPRLQLLLMQKDPEAVSRLLRYYDSISQSLAEQLRQFQQRLVALGTTETQLGEVEQKILAKLAELKAQAQALQAERSTRQRLLAEINRAIKTDKQRLQALQADRARLDQVLGQIQRALDEAALARNDKAFGGLKGKLAWPLEGAVERSFGSVRDNIRYDGIYIAGKDGRPVKAVHHGRVVFADFFRGYGLLIILDHGDNYLSLYGHNQSLNQEVGDWVSAGEVIAATGRSGGQAEPGLYFAIRHKGQPTDPKRWLAGRG